MSAVTGNLEWSNELSDQEGVLVKIVKPGFGALDEEPALVDEGDVEDEEKPGKAKKAKVGAPTLSVSHGKLTRMMWIRRTVELTLAGKGRDKTVRQINLIADGNGKGMLKLQIEPPMPANTVPWAFGSRSLKAVKLWGEANEKMQAPTFDIPAGPTDQGGSCPGSLPGQSTSTLVDKAVREDELIIIPESPGGAEPATPVNLRETICQSCYATGGSYAYMEQQVAEVVRLHWVKSLLSKPNGEEEFVQTMLRGLKALTFNATNWTHEGKRIPTLEGETPDGIWPVRVHASGDFFSTHYAEYWIALANATAKVLPKVHFWAPTRTWVVWKKDAWSKLLTGLKQNNFSIRPSGFHVGDHAPGKLANAKFGASMGSTSIYAHDNLVTPDPKDRYDFNCGTFELNPKTGKAAKNCDKALGPDGKPGCRACWIQPQLRINYQNH